MTVHRIDVWQVKPGRLADLIDVIQDGGAQLQRVGCLAANLLRVDLGGSAPAICYTATAWENAASYGRQFADRMPGDAEWQALMPRFTGPDAPAVHQTAQLLSLAAGSAAIPDLTPGMCAVVRGWSVKPERWAEFQAGVERVAALIRPQGGSSSILRTLIGGVPPLNTHTVAWYPNQEQAGLSLDALLNNAALQAAVAPLIAADGPGTHLVSRIDTVIV